MSDDPTTDPESVRLAEDARREKNWKRWGPYLSERQWATVREDYSPDNSRWHFALTASNLGDKAGINSRYTDPFGIKQTSDEYIAPRQFIATVGYTF